MKKNKVLITYVHFYRPDKEIYSVNLDFFNKLGVIDSDQYHYNFVLTSDKGWEKLPEGNNITKLKASNDAYDFGGYAHSVNSSNIDDFDYFIFLNDTCRGPYIPDYIPNNLNWIDLFLNKLSDSVRLVGPTWWTRRDHWYLHQIGVPPEESCHIQSFCYGLDKNTLKELITAGFYDTSDMPEFENTELLKEYIIANKEIGMSRYLLNRGYEIKPFQSSQYMEEENGDINHPANYFGTTVNPFDIMFMKTVRLHGENVVAYTKFALAKHEALMKK